MKKCLKVFISMFIIVAFIITGCAKKNSMEGDPPGWSSAHLYTIEGRVTEIVGKNTVLVNVLRENRDFQKEDTVAVKYDISRESERGLDNPDEFEEKLMEAQIGDIVSVSYEKAEKRDIGEIKDCHYISTWYLSILPEERYKALYPDDAD